MHFGKYNEVRQPDTIPVAILNQWWMQDSLKGVPDLAAEGGIIAV